MKYRMSMATFAMVDRCRGPFKQDCPLELDESLATGQIVIEDTKATKNIPEYPGVTPIEEVSEISQHSLESRNQ